MPNKMTVPTKMTMPVRKSTDLAAENESLKARVNELEHVLSGRLTGVRTPIPAALRDREGRHTHSGRGQWQDHGCQSVPRSHAGLLPYRTDRTRALGNRTLQGRGRQPKRLPGITEERIHPLRGSAPRNEGPRAAERGVREQCVPRRRRTSHPVQRPGRYLSEAGGGDHTTRHGGAGQSSEGVAPPGQRHAGAESHDRPAPDMLDAGGGLQGGRAHGGRALSRHGRRPGDPGGRRSSRDRRALGHPASEAGRVRTGGLLGNAARPAPRGIEKPWECFVSSGCPRGK